MLGICRNVRDFMLNLMLNLRVANILNDLKLPYRPLPMTWKVDTCYEYSLIIALNDLGTRYSSFSSWKMP